MDLNQSEPTKKYQRLTLLDLIWLVIASGVGVGVWIFQARVLYQSNVVRVVPSSAGGWITLGSTLMMPFAWLVTLKGVRLSGRERLQPGYVACFAVLLASFVGVTDRLSGMSGVGQNAVRSTSLLGVISFCFIASPWNVNAFVSAVGIGWLIVFWEGKWKRSTSTIESLGRWVGCWFIVAFVGARVIEFVARTRSFGLPKLFPLFGIAFALITQV